MVRIHARERLAAAGPDALSDEELVSLVLGTGARGEPVTVVAARLLATVGGLGGLTRMGMGALTESQGIGPSKAGRLLAALALGRRVVAMPLPKGRPIRSSGDVARALLPRLSKAPKEHFLAIPLDAKNRPLGEISVSKGGLTGCTVTPADVFRDLLREAAAGVIFVHNHPSGDPSPSPEDAFLTRELHRAGSLLGLRVLDHVILGEAEHFSFLDSGLLPSGSTAA
jgi:DNA repair protein RadC